MVFGG